jgi:hypothetical protein
LFASGRWIVGPGPRTPQRPDIANDDLLFGCPARGPGPAGGAVGVDITKLMVDLHAVPPEFH